MKELFHRFFSDVPTFWRRVQVFGGSLFALGLALLKIEGIPPQIKVVAGHFTWIGSTLAVVAQFACTNTPGAGPVAPTSAAAV